MKISIDENAPANEPERENTEKVNDYTEKSPDSEPPTEDDEFHQFVEDHPGIGFWWRHNSFAGGDNMKIDVRMNGMAELESAIEEVNEKTKELEEAVHKVRQIRMEMMLRINQPPAGEADGRTMAIDQNEH